MLENVIKGKTPEPPKILIYGNPGVGKSTFAADAPDAIFSQTEDGLNNLDVTKLPLCANYADVLAQLAALANEEHDFKTLCFDSLTNLERFIHAEVCRQFGVKNIEKADGGFAKGYKHALNYWQDIIDALNYLNKEKKMMIVLTAHQGVQEVKDPETDTYHRTAPRLHNLAEYMIEEWCDCVFHAKKQFRVQKADEGFGNKRGIASALGADGGERVIRTIGTAAVVAKNRYDLPEHLPLDFKAFWDGVNANLEK
jgi:hypothetical protein